LIGLINWVQDFKRISDTPDLASFAGDSVAFRAALDDASNRAEVRKIEKDQSDTVSKAADPGKFKDERKWPEWEPAFVNYLSTIPGVNGVPLSYVVREKEEPDSTGTFESFNERAIACSPLAGAVFQADARKVHQLIKSFLQTETAEQWIKPLARRQSGRADMKALRDHYPWYSGEGNTSRRIAVAERIRDTLHYKNERAMPFSGFLDKLQKMFNIFEEENEVISDQAKVRILLKKVEHPQLQDAIGALRVRATIGGGITFTECANHLSAQVSELPDHQMTPRKVSGTGSNRVGKSSDSKRIRGGNGSVSGKRNGIHMPLMAAFGPDFTPIGTSCPKKTAKPSSILGYRTRLRALERPLKSARPLGTLKISNNRSLNSSDPLLPSKLIIGMPGKPHPPTLLTMPATLLEVVSKRNRRKIDSLSWRHVEFGSALSPA
jgi:hypothetical protein